MEDDDQQVASHEQQYNALDSGFGPLPDPSLWFRDDKSGKDFERPRFKEMLDVCRANPNCGGVIEVYSTDRWGRPVKRVGRELKANPAAFFKPISELEELGWDVAFLDDHDTGDDGWNFVLSGIKAVGAASYLQNLSKNVARGKRDYAKRGLWPYGRPPWPAVRYDPKNPSRPLKSRVRDKEGNLVERGERVYQSGTILGPGPNTKYWILAAKKVLQTRSVYAGALLLNEMGVPSPTGKRWSRPSMESVLQSRALIGEIRLHNGDGTVEYVQAQWDPIVPIDLFKQVQEVISLKDGKFIPKRRGDNPALISPTCAFCGAPYYRSYQADKRRGRKHRDVYVHPGHLAPVKSEYRDRMVEKGCQQWSICARQLEGGIKDLILRERLTPNFVERLRALIEEKQAFSDVIRLRLERAKEEIRQIEEDQENLLDLELQSRRGGGKGSDTFTRKQRELAEARERAQALYDRALEDERKSKATWLHFFDLIKESDELKAAWDSGDIDRQREIMNWWVDAVSITVEREKYTRGKRTHTRTLKVAHVFLAQAPGIDLDMPLSAMNRARVKANESAESSVVPCPQQTIGLASGAPAPRRRR